MTFSVEQLSAGMTSTHHGYVMYRYAESSLFDIVGVEAYLLIVKSSVNNFFCSPFSFRNYLLAPILPKSIPVSSFHSYQRIMSHDSWVIPLVYPY